MTTNPTNDRRLVAIILAAGESSRLGQPKQLVNHQGKPLIRRLVKSCIETAHFSRIIVVLGSQAERIAHALVGLPAETVHATDWKKGMSASIRAGMAKITGSRKSESAAMITLCDQPNLDADSINKLVVAWRDSGKTAAAARYHGRPAAPVIFDRIYFDRLVQFTGDAGARDLLRAMKNTELAQVDLPELAFDLDRPEDLAKLSESSRD